jgi:hypothetical protein
MCIVVCVVYSVMYLNHCNLPARAFLFKNQSDEPAGIVKFVAFDTPARWKQAKNYFHEAASAGLICASYKIDVPDDV